MNVLFTLCGRAGSKGFKNKNLKNFLDYPLVYYSIAAISLYADRVVGKNMFIDAVVNTDSEELIELVEKQDMFSFMIIRRKEFLSGDAVPKVAVIKDCVKQMEDKKKISYDLVVDLDITSPLRTVQDIINAMDKKIGRPETDVVYSVVESRRNPYFNMVKEVNGFFCKAISSEYTMRQQAPVFYDMNASIYVYSASALKTKQATIFFNDNCDAIFMKDTGVLDIDSEEDFVLMEVVAKYLFENAEGYKEIRKRILQK